MSADESKDNVMRSKNEIILRHDNCFNLLKDMPDREADLVCTDPPYDIPESTARRVGVKPLTMKEKITIVSEYKRTLKNTGSVVTFCGYNDMPVWIDLFKKQGFRYRRPLVWVYRNPSGIPTKDNFYSAMEMILYFTKSGKYYFKPDTIIFNWFESPAAGGLSREKPDEYLWDSKLGTTPKPLPVVRTLVDTLCPPYGVVIDPFMGSGTTGVACVQLGMRFIGFEIKKHIYEYAVERINKVPWKKVIDDYPEMLPHQKQGAAIVVKRRKQSLMDFSEDQK